MRISLRAYYLIIGFFCISCLISRGQDQDLVDSLTQIYSQDTLDVVEKMELLRVLSYNSVYDYELSSKYADELIDLANTNKNYLYLYRGYLQKGNTNRFAGNYEQSIDAFFKSAEAAILEKYLEGEGAAYISVADVYSEMGNSVNAELYYGKGIDILRQTSDSISLAGALLNAGDEFFSTQKFDAALIYFEESGQIYELLDYSVGKAYNLGNVGMVYAEQGKDALAEQFINDAIIIMEELEHYYPISVYLTYMADIYQRQDKHLIAIEYANRSLDLSKQYELKEQISDANLKLSELHEVNGDHATSLAYYREHIIYRDSVKNIEVVQQMADQRTDFEVSQKQAEVDLLNEQKRTQRVIVIATVIALVLIALMAVGLYRRNKFIKETNKIIAAEKDRSENLLLNILPEQTAQELKDHGKVKANKFEEVSVLFTDFKGFTHYSENLEPELLVESVDFYFSKFDAIMEKHGLEKIKTIGDAYMCAAGLPFPAKDHATKMVGAALEMLQFVNEAKENSSNGATRFDIRIGINSGPVVAGVVGTKKFSYDIWGDTVNVAARMESNSEPGKINISENTYQLVKEDFNCSFRGELEAKNRGKLRMYFVDGKLV